MVKRERLYDAFGELLYVIAMADGAIQDEEVKVLEGILNKHTWAKEIKWSFDYEKQKQHTIEEAYTKAIDVCKANGPDPEYKYLLDVMYLVADAFDGTVKQEEELIDRFKCDLHEEFLKQLSKQKPL